MQKTRNAGTLPEPLAARLASVVAARMCHDLISPIGAIGNGLELMELTGAQNGPELALVSESLAQAQARIRFFRIAYGEFSADQRINAGEVRSVLKELTAGRHLTIEWNIETDMLRRDVKLAFLVLQCVETALGRGGRVLIQPHGTGWQMTTADARLDVDVPLWAAIATLEPLIPTRPALVQFALVPVHCITTGCRLSLHHDADALTVVHYPAVADSP